MRPNRSHIERAGTKFLLSWFDRFVEARHRAPESYAELGHHIDSHATSFFRVPRKSPLELPDETTPEVGHQPLTWPTEQED